MQMKMIAATLALAGVIGAAQAEGVTCVSYEQTPYEQYKSLSYEQKQLVEAANEASVDGARDKLIPGYMQKLRDGRKAGDGSLLYAIRFQKVFKETVMQGRDWEYVKTADQNNDLLCLGTPDELRASASSVPVTVSTSLSKNGGECQLAVGEVMSKAVASQALGVAAGYFWVNPFQDASFPVRDAAGKPGILYCPAGGVREQIKLLGLSFNL